MKYIGFCFLLFNALGQTPNSVGITLFAQDMII